MKNFFLSYKNPVSVILAVIIVGGIFLYGQIQVSLFPEITFPKLKVIADNGEQPVDKMMVTVTRPLEDAVKQAFAKKPKMISVNLAVLESGAEWARKNLQIN